VWIEVDLLGWTYAMFRNQIFSTRPYFLKICFNCFFLQERGKFPIKRVRWRCSAISSGVNCIGSENHLVNQKTMKYNDQSLTYFCWSFLRLFWYWFFIIACYTFNVLIFISIWFRSLKILMK
jgi:hypothetical protein